MIELLERLFARMQARFSKAGPRDAPALAALHGASFHRGWTEEEFERLLIERAVVAHRAMLGRRLVGFILSRMAADEAEILSVAVTVSQRGRGLARRLLDLHLRQLAGLGIRSVFLEVDGSNLPARRLYDHAGFEEVGRREDYYPAQGSKGASALVLRRDLA